MKRLLPVLALGAMLAFPVTLAQPASADIPPPNGGPYHRPTPPVSPPPLASPTASPKPKPTTKPKAKPSSSPAKPTSMREGEPEGATPTLPVPAGLAISGAVAAGGLYALKRKRA